MDHEFSDSDLEFSGAGNSEELFLDTSEASSVYLDRRDLDAIAKYFGCLVVEDLK
tara:strand:- start:703 stop:867 length:165 start_codon:yes stop_codon:yes gene_type:complete